MAVSNNDCMCSSCKPNKCKCLLCEQNNTRPVFGRMELCPGCVALIKSGGGTSGFQCNTCLWFCEFCCNRLYFDYIDEEQHEPIRMARISRCLAVKGVSPCETALEEMKTLAKITENRIAGMKACEAVQEAKGAFYLAQENREPEDKICALKLYWDQCEAKCEELWTSIPEHRCKRNMWNCYLHCQEGCTKNCGDD